MKTHQPPAAVLWDMDGTLVDSEKLWDIALQELAEHLGGRLSAEARVAMTGSHVTATLELLFADIGMDRTPELDEQAGAWLERRVAELFATDLPWQPGAEAALGVARECGLPTALVTSTVRSLTDLALCSIGGEFFDVTVCGDEVGGRTKPHPEPYLRAARLLGVDPNDCLAVEDSPTGVSSASAAGCSVLVVPGELPVPPGDRRLICDSLIGFDPRSIALELTSRARR